MRFWITRMIWRLLKKFDTSKPLNESQQKELARYYETGMRIFSAIKIDINAMPIERQRLYTAMLIYLDSEEVICPSGARTATMINFLESLSSGWILPPVSQVVSKEFAKEIDGYVALEIMRNNLGVGDIFNELKTAINANQAFSTY